MKYLLEAPIIGYGWLIGMAWSSIEPWSVLGFMWGKFWVEIGDNEGRVLVCLYYFDRMGGLGSGF